LKLRIRARIVNPARAADIDAGGYRNFLAALFAAAYRYYVTLAVNKKIPQTPA
jgi:hypothetical protein